MLCCPLSLSCFWLFATPWTVALQALSRQEYWSGLSCHPPGDLPDPGIKHGSPALQAGCLLLSPQGNPNWVPSVDQHQPQAMLLVVNLIDVLSIPLRGNGSAGIQEAIQDQTGSRPPNSEHDSFGASLALGSALELLLSPTTELSPTIVPGCSIWRDSLLLCRIRDVDRHFKMMIFFFLFWFAVSSWVPTLGFLLFQFVSNAKWLWKGWHWVVWQFPV